MALEVGTGRVILLVTCLISDKCSLKKEAFVLVYGPRDAVHHGREDMTAG